MTTTTKMNKEMELNLDGMEQGTGQEAEDKARKLGWSTGWFTVRSFEAIHNRKLVF